MSPITKKVSEVYQGYLYNEKRSWATVEKYLGDVRRFAAYLEEYGGGDEREVVNKDRVWEYKQYLKENCKITSTNFILAATNSFFTYIGHEGWRVWLFRIQRTMYCQPETEMVGQDYRRLIRAAREAGDTRMSMLLQTVGSIGIRISGLKYTSVESLETGRVEIYNKGESRVMLLPGKLVDMLRKYYQKKRI